MRPELTRDLNVDDFRNFYYLKEELQTYCRKNGISASGSKIEITERIATFLETGKILKPMRKSSTSTKKVELEELSLNTIITENHRCSQEVRAF